jgi:ferric-dicitrate binding protein FerR (iron transport regulator)
MLMMSDANRPPTDDEEEAALAALFAQQLVDEPLPPAALDRLAQRVLEEVQHTLPAGQADAADLAPAPQRSTPRPITERVRRWVRRLSPTQSLLLAGAGAVAAMLLFVGISRITPRPLTATAAVSGGDATLLNSQTSRYQIQHDGDTLKLRQGDQLLTTDGSVQLSHFRDHVTVIEPGAYVVLTQLDDAGGGLQLALTVHDGLVHSTLAAPLGANDSYTIHTPVVAVSAVGTDFTVETIDEQETLVVAFAGSVLVTMGEQTVTLGPGEAVDAIAGQTLAVQPAGAP